MTVRTLGVLLLRIWAITMFVGVAVAAASLLSPFLDSDPGMDKAAIRFGLMSSGAGLAVALLCGLVLFIWAERIVSVLGVPEPEAPPEGNYTVGDLQRVAFVAIGAYLGVLALREMFTLVWVIARHPAWDEAGRFAHVFETEQERLVGAVAQLLFAVALLVRPSAWRSVWQAIRPMSQPNDESEHRPSNSRAAECGE
jgi:hypothetical protein